MTNKNWVKDEPEQWMQLDGAQVLVRLHIWQSPDGHSFRLLSILEIWVTEPDGTEVRLVGEEFNRFELKIRRRCLSSSNFWTLAPNKALNIA